MRTERFMYFVLRITSGPRVKFFVSNKSLSSPCSLCYRSKALVLVLFFFCVALWFILRGALCFKVLPFSSFPLALRSPRSGKRELVYVILVHLFVLHV